MIFIFFLETLAHFRGTNGRISYLENKLEVGHLPLNQRGKYKTCYDIKKMPKPLQLTPGTEFKADLFGTALHTGEVTWFIFDGEQETQISFEKQNAMHTQNGKGYLKTVLKDFKKCHEKTCTLRYLFKALHNTPAEFYDDCYDFTFSQNPVKRRRCRI